MVGVLDSVSLGDMVIGVLVFSSLVLHTLLVDKIEDGGGSILSSRQPRLGETNIPPL